MKMKEKKKIEDNNISSRNPMALFFYRQYSVPVNIVTKLDPP